MNLQEIITFTKPFQLHGQEGIFRLYDSEEDNVKLVSTLFTKMNNKEGLEELLIVDTTTFIGSKENFRLVAELKDQLIATMTLMKNPDFKENKIVDMYSVVTKEKFQGTGISGKFFKFACDWVRNLGGKGIELSTLKNNFQAQKFYEKMGCQRFKELDDEIFYRKTI